MLPSRWLDLGELRLITHTKERFADENLPYNVERGQFCNKFIV